MSSLPGTIALELTLSVMEHFEEHGKWPETLDMLAMGYESHDLIEAEESGQVAISEGRVQLTDDGVRLVTRDRAIAEQDI
jgi:hypothetical protein